MTGTEEEVDGGRMSFLGHLDELRKRLIISVIAVLAGALGCWFMAEPIFDLLSRPIIRFLPEGTKLALPKGY